MIETATYALSHGNAPLLISIPHLGSHLPEEYLDRYTPAARRVADTDWHLDRLYSMADGLRASVLRAKVSRYVIDLNRPSTGESLYPGQTTTELCPTTTFRGENVYLDGQVPTKDEIANRLNGYWQPYHEALREELTRLQRNHVHVLLWEAHSIASVLPRLFDGKLPDLCLGTNDGRSCSKALLDSVVAPLALQDRFTHVVNGRFKGGFNTRYYGTPEEGVHAIQLEMCQSLYMNEQSPFEYRDEVARKVQPVLTEMLRGALNHLSKIA